jgi:excisionase family DNA binding protein
MSPHTLYSGKLAKIKYRGILAMVKDYFSVRDAAKYLKKHPDTIRNYIHERKLPAQRLTGKNGIFLIQKNDILEFMVSKMMEKK